MTANEKRFLELELEVLLKRLKRKLERIPSDGRKSVCPKDCEAVVQEIRRKAQQYVKDTVFTRQGGYYLLPEVSVMVEALERIVNHPETGKQLKRALFKEPDMGRVRELAGRIRSQVEPVIREYQSHTKKGEGNGKEDFIITGKDGFDSCEDTGSGKENLQRGGSL